MIKNNYEQMRITERLKEFRTLYIFIICASIVALLLMNFLIFPIAVFAAEKPSLFSSVVKWGTCACLSAYVMFRIVSKIREYTSGGYSVRSLFIMSFKKKVRSILYGLIIILAVLILLFFIYIVMKYNYYFLYEILN